MSGNPYSKSKCERLINNLSSYSFEKTNVYLNTEYVVLQKKLSNVQQSFVKASNNLTGSQYTSKDLYDSKLNNLMISNNLFENLQTCDFLESQYYKIINWQSIKKQEELEKERQRLAIMDEENRIRRKKQEEEEESRRSSYSSSSYSSYSSSDSSSSPSSFSSDSGGGFDGGGGGSDW